MTDWLFRPACVVVFCGAVSLSGCLSAEESRMRDDALHRQMSLDDAAYCQGLSAQPGTDAYVYCRVSRAESRVQQQQAEAMNRRRAVATALSEASDDMERDRRERQGITCTSTPLGTSVTTRCN